ncbi:MAG TPA: DUF2851 family protein [Flavobacterium sp.]|nr:DUF2851 family protein [Flavobacterium sp.]
MKEDFLHYLWKFKKFDTSNLQTSNNEPVTILHSGHYLQLAGPDFFNAQLIIGTQKWAGNVEIHIKSSDWYIHHHEQDEAYENVILHVVWEHDTEIFRKNNTEIPVLELKPYVSEEMLVNYWSLIRPKSWIFCERQLATVDAFILKNWQERLFFERLERKSNPIEMLLEETQSDWETVLFRLLAKNFGLNTNGDIFLKIASAIPFAILRKESQQVENVEALLFGIAGLLEEAKEDSYFKNLKSKFDYLSHKYKIPKTVIEPVQFFKHRPDNFPTIRLSQLANLYCSEPHLFSKIVAAGSVKELYTIFEVTVTEYWKTHYQFDRESPKKTKALSKVFTDLIIINTIVPVQFAYAKSLGKEISGNCINLLEAIAPESNAIIDKFNAFGMAAVNAYETQSLLQLKNDYCAKSRCVECAIGIELLKSNPIKV